MTLNVVLSICAPIRLSLNFMLYLKLCFISSLRHFFSFANSLVSLWLQMFSIILPKTLLLMSLRKSFSNSLLACFPSLVLRSLQAWSHARCLNLITYCTLSSISPCFNAWLKARMCTTYFSLLLRFDTSLSNLLTFIFSTMKIFSWLKAHPCRFLKFKYCK